MKLLIALLLIAISADARPIHCMEKSESEMKKSALDDFFGEEEKKYKKPKESLSKAKRKEIPLKDIPPSAQQALEKFLIGKDGKPLDPTKDREGYENALEKFADTIIKRIKVLQAIKHKKKNAQKIKEKTLEEIPTNIAPTPFTQTMAYLNPDHEENFDYNKRLVEVCKLFMRAKTPEDSELVDEIEEPTEDEKHLFKNILINEQLHADSYVFYHGCVGYKKYLTTWEKEPEEVESYGPGIFFDVYTEIARWLGIDRTSKALLLRCFDVNKTTYTSCDNFFDSKQVKQALTSQDHGFDSKPAFALHLLPVNISLFGRMFRSNAQVRDRKTGKWVLGSQEEFSVNYFLGNRSMACPSTEEKLEETCDLFNFTKKYMFEIMDNYAHYMKETGGHLLQIFVAKDCVDDVAYLSRRGGFPLKTKANWASFNSLQGKGSIPLDGNFDALFEHIDIKNNPKNISVVLDNYVTNKNFINYYSLKTVSYESSTWNRKQRTWEKKVIGQLPWFDVLQARLVLVPSIFADDSKIRIFRYYAEKKPDEAAYQQKLSEIFEKIIKDWIVRRLKGEIRQTKNLASQPLNRLLNCMLSVSEKKK